MNLSSTLAALDESATQGKWCQFHPSYTQEAVGTTGGWDISHQMSAVKDGNRKRIAEWTHARDAHFTEALVNAYRAGHLIVAAAPDLLTAYLAATDEVERLRVERDAFMQIATKQAVMIAAQMKEPKP